DLKALQPGHKFFWHIFAVLCFLKGGLSLKTTFLSSIPNLFFSAFWMLTIINAFNLIDVMDGLASLVAIVATSTLFGIALCFKQYSLSLLLLTFLGPLLAFFIYNRPPARIYLGDTGALFIGGFLAAVPMLFNWSGQSITAYYAPIIILGVPTLEVVSLVIIRTWLGIPFYKGSPHHFSIFLQKKGWSKNTVLLFTTLASAILSAIALCFLFGIISWIIMMLCLAVFLALWSIIVF
ncbi:MAG: MraY family glycosyltransferase, partial [Candidatus Babeliales bacterium]